MVIFGNDEVCMCMYEYMCVLCVCVLGRTGKGWAKVGLKHFFWKSEA